MLTEDLAIYKDTQSLCKMLLEYQTEVPKTIKYSEYSNAITYGFNIINTLHEVSVVREAGAKIEKITRILTYANCIKSRISIFTDLKYIPIKKATNIILLVDKICKQATGWINSLK